MHHQGPEGPIVGIPREPSRRAYFQAPTNGLIHQANRARAEARSSQRELSGNQARDDEYELTAAKRRARHEAEEEARDRARAEERERDLLEQSLWIETSVEQARAAREAQGRADFMASLDKEVYLEGAEFRLAEANAAVEEVYKAQYRLNNPDLLDKKGEIILWDRHIRR